MREIQGDILDLWHDDTTVIKFVPTNGELDHKGNAVMETGLAKDCAIRYPAMPSCLSLGLKLHGNRINFLGHYDAALWFSFPTRSNSKDKASKSLILFNCLLLRQMVSKAETDTLFLLPHIGCGQEGLNWKTDIKPVLLSCFDDNDNVTVVSKK